MKQFLNLLVLSLFPNLVIVTATPSTWIHSFDLLCDVIVKMHYFYCANPLRLRFCSCTDLVEIGPCENHFTMYLGTYIGPIREAAAFQNFSCIDKQPKSCLKSISCLTKFAKCLRAMIQKKIRNFFSAC